MRALEFAQELEVLHERAKLLASNGGPFAEFGFSVAVSGETLVVGAPGQGPPAVAYVFVRPPGGWAGTLVESALLVPSNAEATGFGGSIAIDGDTVVVGAPFDSATFLTAGAAWVFVRPPGGWSGTVGESAKLAASDAAEEDYLGWAVALAGDAIAVGAFGEDEAASEGGAVYVFVRPPSGWAGTLTEDAKLLASSSEDGANLGTAVAAEGNVIVAGAPGASAGALQSGAAYVFVRPAPGWSGTLLESARLSASDGAFFDQLGRAVSMSGGTVVAGAPYQATLGTNAGAAYVFREPPGGWSGALTESARLFASDGEAVDLFGEAVAACDGLLVVGAYGDDDRGNSSGAAYLFDEPAGGWSGTMNESARLLASDGAAGDQLGRAVACAADTVVAGARHDADNGPGSGSAYVLSGRLFTDGFETGDTSAWSAAQP